MTTKGIEIHSLTPDRKGAFPALFDGEALAASRRLDIPAARLSAAQRHPRRLFGSAKSWRCTAIATATPITGTVAGNELRPDDPNLPSLLQHRV